MPIKTFLLRDKRKKPSKKNWFSSHLYRVKDWLELYHLKVPETDSFWSCSTIFSSSNDWHIFLLSLLRYMCPWIAWKSVSGAHGTSVLLTGWQTLSQENASTGYRWNSGSGYCRKISHSSKSAKSIWHLAREIIPNNLSIKTATLYCNV